MICRAQSTGESHSAHGFWYHGPGCHWVVGVAQNVARSLSLSFVVAVVVVAAATPKDYSSIERSPLLCQGRRILYINVCMRSTTTM